MATTVVLKDLKSGLVKNGYFGFSWTTFFFGFFPALFRSDFVTFVGGFVVSLIIGAMTFGIGIFVIAIIWAFMYNKYYTRKLLEKGYVLSDTAEVNQKAAAALGVSLEKNA